MDKFERRPAVSTAKPSAPWLLRATAVPSAIIGASLSRLRPNTKTLAEIPDIRQAHTARSIAAAWWDSYPALRQQSQHQPGSTLTPRANPGTSGCQPHARAAMPLSSLGSLALHRWI